jgi:hypothetical protein
MSKWTEHVKAYAEKHKISYKEAMVAAKDSYKPEKSEKKSPEMKKSPEKKEKKEKKEKGEKKEKKEEGEKEHKMPKVLEKGGEYDNLKKKHEHKKREMSAEALQTKKNKILM